MLTIGSLQYPQNGRIGENTINQWWGNTVFKNTTDWYGIPLRRLAPNETFGYAWVALPFGWGFTDEIATGQRAGSDCCCSFRCLDDCMYFIMFGHCVDAAVVYMLERLFQFEPHQGRC